MKLIKPVYLVVVALIATSLAPNLALAQIDLNPNTIEGTVQIGSETISFMQIRADSGPLASSVNLSPNSNSAMYSLTVQVEPGTSRNFLADADVRLQGPGNDRLFLRDRPVTVTDGVIAVQDFIFPNVVTLGGTVTVTGGGVISSVSLFIQETSSPSDFYQTTESSVNATSSAFSLPVLPNQDLRCSGSVTLITGARINLPSQIVTSPASGTVQCNYNVATPQVGSIEGSLNFTGPNDVSRYVTQFSGPASVNPTLLRNDFTGPGSNESAYTISDVPVGTYSGFVYSYLNNFDNFLRFPDDSYNPSRSFSVTTSGPTTIDIEACQAFIDGEIEFTGSATLGDLSFGTINALQSSGNGFANDRLAPASGTYNLVVSAGDWAPYNASLRLSRSTSDPRGYINENLNLTFDIFPYDVFPIACGATEQRDFSFATGSTSISFGIGGGQTFSSPRISGFCTYTDPSTGDRLYQYSYSSFGLGSNLTQATIDLEAPQGSCTVRAEASVNGSFLTFGTLDAVPIEPGTDVVIDVGGPTLAILSPEPNFCIDANSITVSGTATDDVEVVSVTINGVSTTLTSTNNPSDPNEVGFSAAVSLPVKGPNTLTIVATDSAGKIGQVTRTVFNDSGPPAVTFSPADGASTSDAAVDISGNATDDAGIDSVVISVNGSQLAVLDGSAVLDFDFDQLGAALDIGSNTITVVATDISEKQTVVTHGIERLANSPPAANAGGPYTVDEGSTVALSGSGSSDPDGDVLTYSWDLDGDGFVFEVVGETPTYDASALDDSVNQIALMVADPSGESDVDDSTVTVQNVAPSTDAGPDAVIDEGSSFAGSGSFSDPGTLDSWSATVDYGESAGSIALALNPDKTFNLGNLYDDDGAYTVTVEVLDDDGGVGGDSATITVSNVAPSVDAGPDATLDEGGTFASSGGFADPGTDTWTATVDYGEGAGPQPLALSGNAFSLNNLYEANGTYTVSVTVTDDDGGIGSDTATVTVVNVAPTVGADASAVTVNEAQTANNGGSFADVGNDTVTITASAGTVTQAGAQTGNWSWSFATTNGPVESQTVTITANDGDGGIGSVTFELIVNNVAPAVDAGPDATLTESDTFASGGSFADPGADIWTATVDYDEGAGPEALTLSGSAFSLSNLYEDDGVYTVTVTVTDSDGGVGSDSVTVTVVNAAPTVDANAPSVTVEEGQAAGNSGTFDDVGDDTVAITASVGSISQTGSQNGTWNWSFGSTDGPDETQTVTITATDSDGAVSTTTFELIVNNAAPTVAADASSVTINEAQTAGNSGSFADVGDDIVTISASVGGISQTGSNGGTWSWVFNSTDGPDESQTVIITATDSDGATTMTTFDLTVLNVPPVADDDAYGTLEDTVLNVAVPGALDGDTDVGADALSATVDTGPSNGTLVLNTNGSFDYTPNLNFNGTDGFTYTVTDDDGATDVGEVTINVTPVNDAPSVTANDVTAQYSDPVLVTILASDIDSTDLSIGMTALPAGLTLSAASCTANAAAPPGGLDCTWTVAGNVTAAPGSYSVTVTVSDNGELTDTTALSAQTTFEIEVLQEDARSTYTGPLFLSSAENGDFTVTLMATIRDISAVTGDPAMDPNAGDIGNATVRFVDNSGATLCSSPGVALVFAGDETVGSASCNYSGSLGNNVEELPIEVSIVVENYYTDTSDNEVVVLVVRPGDGKITGGGQLELENSAGVYAADPDKITNYGFNAMAQKKGKKNIQLKGRATVIVRTQDGRKYKIKSNALLSLGVDLGADPNDEPFYAEFEAKANLTDVTDPLNPISLGGNLLLQLRMTDNGEPGENDTISFTLWDGGTLLFSSNWDGAQSVEQHVARGNLQVHP